MRKISQYVNRWWVAVLATLALAAATLLPALDAPGLWEPTERLLADRVAPPDPVQAELDKQKALTAQALAQQPPQQKPPEPKCRKAPPDDALARSLQYRAMKAGRDYVADDDFGRKLPFALLGLLTVLAAAGIAMRLARARAGIVTAVVLLSMPLLVLQSRMLTSDIGTACGAALVIFGLVMLHRTRHVHLALGIGAMLLGAIALAAGIAIGFVAGGALLGLLVPIGAVAAAGKLGIPFVVDVGKAAYNAWLWTARRVYPRAAVGRERLVYGGAGYGPAFLATLLAVGLASVLAYQLYDLSAPHPGIHPPVRRIGDTAIVPEACYSWLLGGVWRAEDDMRFVFDSTWEQIAYGTYPWGILGPIAMILLLRDPDPGRRAVGGLTLAWAGAAWIATEAFQRKVGMATFSGFPAIAIAIGVWIDAMIERRRHGALVPAGALLLALFVAFAVVDLGKDMIAFPEKLTSLVANGETVPYPAEARIAGVKVKHSVMLMGVLTIGGLAVALSMRRLALPAAIASIGATVIMAGYWAFAWHPRIADHLSSKSMFETYRALRKPGDHLLLLGDLGHAPYAYADNTKIEKAATRDTIVQAFKRPNRVFAIAPQSELCHIHREARDYFVIDNRNTRNLLFSNKLAGATDKNPLREMIVHEEPKQIRVRPKSKIVWDNRIELLGWDIPKRARRGSKMDVTVYYKILQPVGGNWNVFMHFDGPAGMRFSGDHKPIEDRCPTQTWQTGDYIIDRTTVVAGGAGHLMAKYDLWIGFFTGSAPNFKNMDLTLAPDDMKDANQRVKITSVILD